MTVLKRAEYIDLQAEAQINDPYPMYDAVRSINPVYKNDDNGLWYITGHPELSAFLHNAKFSSQYYRENKDQTFNLSEAGIAYRKEMYMGGLAMPTYAAGRSLPTWDPPEHTARRQALAPYFLARSVEAMKPVIQRKVDALIANLRGKEAVEFIREFAYELPVNFVQCLLGIPEDQAPAYVDYDEYDKVRRVKSGVGSDEDYRRAAASGKKYMALIEALIAARRADPDNGLTTALLNLDVPRCPYSQKDIYAELYCFIHAGHSTSTAFLGNLVYFLLKFKVWEQVRDNPELIPTAMEEILRWDPPQHIVGRIALEDIEFYGQIIKKDDIILGFTAAANRDPRVFDTPNEFVVDRKPNPHLTFGQATHFCIGAPFGRMEGELMLKALFEAFPNLSLADEPKHSHCIGFGLDSLPLRLN